MPRDYCGNTGLVKSITIEDTVWINKFMKICGCLKIKAYAIWLDFFNNRKNFGNGALWLFSSILPLARTVVERRQASAPASGGCAFAHPTARDDF